MTTQHATRWMALLTCGLLACGEGSSGLEWAAFTQEIAPATHDSAVVGHTIPAAMSPGEKQSVRVTMQNTGTASPGDDWENGYRFYSRNTPLLEWGWVSTAANAVVTVGNQRDFYFVVRAPAANPTADFGARMLALRGDGQNGFFGATFNHVVNVDAAVQRAWDCTLVADTVPATMSPGLSAAVTIEVRNTGTQTWTANDFCLRDTDNDWGSTVCPPNGADVAPNATHTFAFTIRAPTATGLTPFRRQMLGMGGPTQPGGIGYFDDVAKCVDQIVDVTGAVPWSSVLVAEDFPTHMIQDELRSVDVTMRNTGTEPWTNQITLYSRNTPLTLWNVVHDPVVGTVAPNATHTFTLRIRAPGPGAHNHRWQNIGFGTTPASGFFGPTIDLPVQVVARTELDTATTPADRLFQATNLNTVGSGDFNGDGVADVIVGNTNGLDGNGVRYRALAGTVFGYTGGGTFFGTALTNAPTGSAFQILGADTYDHLGAGASAGIRIGDVYGGTAPRDVVVSAGQADGVANARTNAGEVYVFDGAGLAGFVDLSTTTPSLTARIIGPVAGGGARILDVADVNGDTFDDLLIGVPFASPGGRTNAGEVYIISGGAGLTGTIDLATVTAPLLIARFEGDRGVAGQLPGDQLGQTGVLATLDATAGVDVLLGAPTHSAMFERAGAAYLVSGPLAGTYDMAMGYDTRWRSRDEGAGLGANVAAADVRGTNAIDVVISGIMILSLSVGEPASARGGVLVLEGPAATGDVFLDKVGGYAGVDSAIFGDDFRDGFGSSLSTGDFNGDGWADLLVGAYAADGPADATLSAGAAAIILGGPFLGATFDLSASDPVYLVHGPRRPALMGRFRQGVTMGDFDGDGTSDFCVNVSNGGNEIYCIDSTF